MSHGDSVMHVSIRHMVSIQLVTTGNASKPKQEAAETQLLRNKI